MGYFYCKLRSLPTALSPRRGAHPEGKVDLGRLYPFYVLTGTPVTKTDYERKAYRCIQSKFYMTQELS